MLPLIMLIGAAIAGLAVIVIALLSWDEIIDWFKNHQELKQSDKENIAFSLQEKLKNGKFKTVQGIFNTNTNELKAGKTYESEEIDETLAEKHRNDELVVYE